MNGYSAKQIAGSGADYLKIIVSSVNVGTLQRALQIALNGDRKQYSKTMIKALEREIRRKLNTKE
jgi:hypothetical protein